MHFFEKIFQKPLNGVFDIAKRKISKNAADPAETYGFTKQKHIRGDKTLNKYKLGPNVIYFCFEIT